MFSANGAAAGRAQEAVFCVLCQVLVGQCRLGHLGIFVYTSDQCFQAGEVGLRPDITTHYKSDFLTIEGLQTSKSQNTAPCQDNILRWANQLYVGAPM